MLFGHDVLSEQPTTADVLPVGGNQCPLLCCCVLGCNIKRRVAERLDRLVRKTSSVLGKELESLTSMAEKRSLSKPL